MCLSCFILVLLGRKYERVRVFKRLLIRSVLLLRLFITGPLNERPVESEAVYTRQTVSEAVCG